jgi:hypothetical protein
VRALRHFSAGEWLQLLPLQHAAKQWRNDALLAIYQGRHAAEQELFLQQVAPLRGGNIALVIAFENPWVIDWQLAMAKRHLADTKVLVFDNSGAPAPRTEIARVCTQHGTPYLALPRNRARHVNRSHGMAMSWVFDQIVRRIEPRQFAFLDHDLIPLLPVSLAERLGDQPFFGLPLTSRWGWALWAGYCVFDYARVATLPLNFLYDFSNGLDTGSRNWAVLYQHFNAEALRFAGDAWLDVATRSTGDAQRVQVLDSRWLHIGGISYNKNFDSKEALCKELAQAFADGRTWQQILATGV